MYNPGESFVDVDGTYARIFDTETNKELSRFTLTNCIDKISNGNIVLEMFRKGDKWLMRGKGYYTRGSTTQKMIPIIKQLIKKIYTNVKIIHEGENCTEHGWIADGVTRSECT